jgi:CheY-specific phosphatase CheX
MKASEFAELVPGCCGDVLDSMYFTTVLETSHPKEPGDAVEGEEIAVGDEEHAFSLGFQGDVCGRFGLHLGAATGRMLAANFLGEDEADLSAIEIAEVIGELANMLCGAVVSKVEGRSKFVLSHPLAMQLLPKLGGEDALVSRFDTDGGTITTWVVVEGNA